MELIDRNPALAAGFFLRDRHPMLKGIAARHPSTARNGLKGWRCEGHNGGAEGIGRTIKIGPREIQRLRHTSLGDFVRRRLWVAAEKRRLPMCDATLSD